MTPAGGWGQPWPSVAEIERVFPHENWTLVGGLMTQLHSVHAGMGVVRATNDIDMVLHVETTRGVAGDAADALESLGYRLVPPVDPRAGMAHRFRRDSATVDLVTSTPGGDDVVDVLLADHAAPSVVETLRGRTMVTIDGGTQALRRTVDASLSINPDQAVTVSVPGAFGALILKAAAYQADSRNPERHLQDAVVLLCCIEDPYAEKDSFAGSDNARIQILSDALPDDSRRWRTLTPDQQVQGKAALRILSA